MNKPETNPAGFITPPDLSRFNNRRILVVGDLMIDEYVWGKVDRISPEAPVPVVEVDREDFTLGGAGNVVNNLAALGARVSVAGVIGPYADGDRMISMFKKLRVDAGGVIREAGRPTTRKTRIIAGSQHVLRIDRETRREISDETFDALKRFIEKRLPESDAVMISDYGKGLFTPSFLSHLIQEVRKHGRPLIADPKGLDFSKYAGVTVLTPNLKEASLAAGVEIVNTETLKKAGEKLLAETGIENLLITRGKDGMALFEKAAPPDQRPRLIKAETRQVFDVSGAGDTVVSVLGLALASGFYLPESAAIANTAAGIVVGKMGTATVSRQELSAAFKNASDDVSAKYKTPEEIAAVVRDIRRRNGRVVLTNGCFDLIHAGHIRLFSASREMGDALIVAIDDDDSVRRLKGEGRPVIGAGERVRILSALDSVDYVTVFSSEDLPRLIDAIRPDVLTKGSNYSEPEVAEHERVEALGGRVCLIPVSDRLSSSDIIEHIRRNAGSEEK